MIPARSARGDGPCIFVGVYDEPELIVSGIVGMLSREGNLTDVVTIGPGAEDAQVDVMVCDPVGRSVPIEEYLSTVTALSEAPVLVFTWSNRPSSVSRVLSAGASGFVSKRTSAVDLADAVAALHRGERVTPKPSRPVGGPSGRAELSAREAEVLELICRGMSNLEIADELYVSVNSVKTYVRQIYLKIGVARRAQAVAWGLAHGF
jgi:DNA-binding NarL/FixJ family response regulator